MYIDKFNFKGDHYSAAEEILSEVTELEQKCYAVEESVTEGYFTLAEALKNYKVTEIEYLSFFFERHKLEFNRETKLIQIFKTISTVITIFDSSINSSLDKDSLTAINKIKNITKKSTDAIMKTSSIAK